jgi:polysaccharide export outer membrane protein
VSPGDTISVTVVGRDDLFCKVRVPRGGDVILPGAGIVHVTGQTVKQLSSSIAALLEERERLLAPRVLVSVASYAVGNAFVYGAVNSPRAVELPDESSITLTQALASCGGFAPGAGRSTVRITRRSPDGGTTLREVDAMAIAEGVALDEDIELEPGDVVFVPSREPVYVLGEVKKQGPHLVPAEYPLTASRAIAMSEGFTPYARGTRVRVTRRSPDGVKTFVLNVADVIADGNLEKDMVLEPGDIVYVPERVF